MGDFRASAWDLNTNTLITPFAGAEVSYSERLNDAGTCEVKLDLAGRWTREGARRILAYGDNPWKLVVTADADASVLYAGLMMNPKQTSSSTRLEVGGVGLTGYFDQVVLTKDYGTSISPVQLAANVIADIQAQAGANIGLGSAQHVASAPANITPSYKKSAYTTAAQVLADVTAAVVPGTGGVDYTVTHGWGTTPSGLAQPTHTLNLWAPRAGTGRAAGSGLVVDLAAAIEWTWPRSNKQTGNQVIVVGGGSGNAQPVATATSPNPIGGQGQPPLLQQVFQYNHVTNADQLQKIANGNVQMWGGPIATPTVKLPVDYPPCALGSYAIGDDVRIMSEPCVQFPDGKDEWWRIVAHSVELTAGQPTVELTLNPIPAF